MVYSGICRSGWIIRQGSIAKEKVEGNWTIYNETGLWQINATM
jgi:hypothetical protein